MSWQDLVIVVLLWPLIGSQKHLHSILTHILRTAYQRFPARCCCTLCRSSPWPTYSSHEKFWPASENCLCSKTQFWLPLHIYLVGNKLWLLTRDQFWCFLESNLFVQMNFHLLAKCTHDKSLILWIVKIIQCPSSWNTVQLQPLSGILHQHQILSLCLVVINFNSFSVTLQQIYFLCKIISQRRVCLDYIWHKQGIKFFFHNGFHRFIV